jgi:flagellar export protein FliJ
MSSTAGARTKRLSRLIDLRERQVEDCRRALAFATEHVLAGVAAMERIHNEVLQLNQEWHAMAVNGVSQAHAEHFQRATHGLLARLNSAAMLLEKCRAEEAEARRRLEEAMKKKKAVEKLRSRLNEREQAEQRSVEQAQMDEFSVLRAGAAHGVGR